MNKIFSLFISTVLFLAIIAISTGASADNDSNFLTLKLSKDIELQVPKGWLVLGEDLQRLIGTTVEAAMDLSGMDSKDIKKKNLFWANSTPPSTYASVRVTSETPPSITLQEISSITPDDIRQLKTEMQQILQKTLPLQGYQLMEFYGIRIEKISGKPSMVAEYRRTGPKGPVIVQFNTIVTAKQEIGVTLSYRESEKALWKPVLGKIRKSIIVKP